MDENWIWSRYWQYDRVASCMDGAGLRNYGEEVAAGWRAFFEKLPPRSVVLDLCTGNGAIALLAAEVSRKTEKDLVVIGVDRAEIDPKRHVTKFREDLERIEFTANVSVEELPFSSGSASAIVSQYGIEYSDLDRSLAEVGRVLSPAGTIRFVLHAADGSIAGEAARCAQDAEFLLEHVDLPGAAAKCLQHVLSFERGPAVHPSQKKAAEESVRLFQDALDAAARYINSASEVEMIRSTASVLADTFSKRAYFDLRQLIEKVDEVRSEIIAHRDRSSALLAAAVKKDELQIIAHKLEAAGVPQVDCSPLMKKDRLIGYVLEGSRRV